MRVYFFFEVYKLAIHIFSVKANKSPLSCLAINAEFITCPMFQKQPSRGVLRKRCSESMQQIDRRKPMPKCDLNKVSKQFY